MPRMSAARWRSRRMVDLPAPEGPRRRVTRPGWSGTWAGSFCSACGEGRSRVAPSEAAACLARGVWGWCASS